MTTIRTQEGTSIMLLAWKTAGSLGTILIGGTAFGMLASAGNQIDAYTNIPLGLVGGVLATLVGATWFLSKTLQHITESIANLQRKLDQVDDKVNRLPCFKCNPIIKPGEDR